MLAHMGVPKSSVSWGKSVLPVYIIINPIRPSPPMYQLIYLQFNFKSFETIHIDMIGSLDTFKS